MQGALWTAALVLLVAVPAGATESDPAALVSRLYALHAETLESGAPGPADAPHRDAFFTPRLVALFVAEDALREAEGYGNLDFDPFYNGQDFEITGLAIATGLDTGEAAVVVARFSNFGTANEIDYDLLAGPDGWRIDEVRSVDAEAPWTLSELLAGQPPE
jgi:hypothetical protein